MFTADSEGYSSYIYRGRGLQWRVPTVGFAFASVMMMLFSRAW